MINTKKKLEKFLQNYRFKTVRPYLKGDVLDFGGNEGEIKEFVSGNYTLVNYDHSPMEGKSFDTIVALAVVEHIDVDEVFKIFKKFERQLKSGGQIFLTTPTIFAKPVLEFLAFLGILDKENIKEHKHYWSKKDILNLAKESNLKVTKHSLFQIVFNQYAILEKISH